MYNGIHQCAPFITLVLTLVITKAQASKEVQYVRHYVSEEIDAANMKIATDSIKDSAFLDECSWKAQINCVLGEIFLSVYHLAHCSTSGKNVFLFLF